jgi:hypothetical protein
LVLPTHTAPLRGLAHFWVVRPGLISSDLLLRYTPDVTKSLIAMSRASKLTLAATGLGTAGIVYFVHWAQENDRAVCCYS